MLSEGQKVSSQVRPSLNLNTLLALSSSESFLILCCASKGQQTSWLDSFRYLSSPWHQTCCINQQVSQPRSFDLTRLCEPSLHPHLVVCFFVLTADPITRSQYYASFLIREFLGRFDERDPGLTVAETPTCSIPR